MTAQPHLNQISAKGDPGPARSGGGKGLPLILGRKSMLMGMAASVGVVLANAAQPSAMLPVASNRSRPPSPPT